MTHCCFNWGECFLLWVLPDPLSVGLQQFSQGCVLSARLGRNLLIWFIIPRKRWTSETHLGPLTFCIAAILLGSGQIPLSSMICPKIFTSLHWHFSALRVRPNSCKQRRTFCRRCLCSSWVLACTRMSSMWQRTPSMSWRISAVWHWKCSGAEVISNGNLVKQSHPKGIMNIVRRDDSGVS